MQRTKAKRPSAWPSTQVFLLDRVSESRDSQSWQEFVELYLPIVNRFCRQRGLRVDEAEEVTQNVFVNVVRAISGFQYDIQRGRFRSWLCTIACHEILRYRNKHQRQIMMPGDGLSEGQRQRTGDPLDAAWCEAFYAGLYDAAVQRVRPEFDPTTWQAFVLTWEQHVPAAEVAQTLGRNLNWVYKAKFRVIQSVQAVVAQLADDEPVLNLGPR